MIVIGLVGCENLTIAMITRLQFNEAVFHGLNWGRRYWSSQ